VGLDRRRAAAGGLLVLPFLVKNYRVFQFNLVLVYAIAILGLNILTGFNGQFSLGHGAFYAIGAYTAAILMDKAGVPYWATLPAGLRVLLRFGFLMGFPALRLAGHFLALATFALALAVPQLLKYKQIEGLDRRRAGHRADQARAAVQLPLPRPALQRRPLAVLLHAAVAR
jgi:ABC-type branched-subunit amino acid transport system permease subunit